MKRTQNSRAAGRFVASQYGVWRIPVYLFSTGTGSKTFSLATATATLPDGHEIMPFNINAKVFVGSESVTLTAVGSSCVKGPVPVGAATLTATFSNSHSNSDTVSSATFGLQESLNDASFCGGGTVVVDSSWIGIGGTQAILNAATIPANVTVETDISGAASSIVTTIFYLDGNRTDIYMPTGAKDYPFKTLAQLASGVAGITGPFVVVSTPTPSSYTYTGNVSFPAYFMTIFGNGSTWAFTGNVTLNAAFHIENLYTTATGTLTYAATTGTESEQIGGSLTITGGIFTSGYEHFFDMSILSNTLVTLNVGATPVFTNVVGTPRWKSASGATAATVLRIINSASLATGAYTNIDMSNGGLAIVRGFIATNNGTVANINLSGSSAVSATVANGLNGVEAAWVACGSAYTYVAPDGVIALLSGTSIYPLGPIELTQYSLTAQSASIAATTLYTTTAAGIYRVTASVQTTTAGTVGTVLVTVNGTSSATTSLLTSAATQSLSTTFYAAAAFAIQYTTTVVSNTGGTYRVDAIVERVG